LDVQMRAGVQVSFAAQAGLHGGKHRPSRQTYPGEQIGLQLGSATQPASDGGTPATVSVRTANVAETRLKPGCWMKP
jgi:hypothetical protein